MSCRNMLSAMALTAIVSLAGPAAVAGQEGHVVERAELERATAERAGGERARREAIRSVLERPEVRSVAGEQGIDITRAEDAVATLEGEALAAAHEQARTVEAALAGGDQVVISSTLVIIALLVLILIAVS